MLHEFILIEQKKIINTFTDHIGGNRRDGIALFALELVGAEVCQA
jgi:hypothetical protein